MTPIRTDYNHFVELIMKMKSQVCNTSIFALVTIGFISAIIGNFFLRYSASYMPNRLRNLKSTTF